MPGPAFSKMQGHAFIVAVIGDPDAIFVEVFYLVSQALVAAL